MSPDILVIYTHDPLRGPLRNLQPKSRVNWLRLDKHHPLWNYNPIQLTEPLHGPDGDFLRSIIDNRPKLLLLEVRSIDSPAIHLIHLLKTSAATSRIAIAAIANSDRELERSRRTGADESILETEWSAKDEELLKR